MKLLVIQDCRSCPFLDHSGNFARGGARPVCGKTDDRRRISKKPLNEWNGQPPTWCPLIDASNTQAILDVINPAPTPPDDSIWVKVDPFDFQMTDDGDTANYGGEIWVTNNTNVDVTIDCSGTDRGDDHCYWPTTEAILDALFSVVPGVADADYAAWEELNDAVTREITPMGKAFYVYVDHTAGQVIILTADGRRLTHGIPLPH